MGARYAPCGLHPDIVKGRSCKPPKRGRIQVGHSRIDCTNKQTSKSLATNGRRQAGKPSEAKPRANTNRKECNVLGNFRPLTAPTRCSQAPAQLPKALRRPSRTFRGLREPNTKSGRRL